MHKLRLYFTLTLLLCAAVTLSAQNLKYDLSDYKARFERRPGMEFNFNSDFAGTYQNRASGGFNGSFSGDLQWFLNRNTDNLISNWEFLTLADIGRNLPRLWNIGSIFPLPRPQEDNYLLAFGARLQQDRYRRPNRFWGYSAQLAAVDAGVMRIDAFESEEREGAIDVTASLYHGLGRIEFAEDALLANWMLQDLQAAGVTTDYSSEDVKALATTITDIIGNRIFDFRRRRIYELKQLQQTLLERGITQEESFELFAILNDNWAFSNRATLTHGNRLAYGLQANIIGTFSRSFSSTEPERRERIEYIYDAFAEYTRSRIVRNNNGSRSLGVRAGLTTTPERDEALAMVSLNYTRTWLPNSRTSFDWSNTLMTRRYVTNNDPRGDNLYIFPSESIISSLTVNYFISYQWTFQLRVSGQAFYRPEYEPAAFFPIPAFAEQPTFEFLPSINFGTRYLFF